MMFIKEFLQTFTPTKRLQFDNVKAPNHLINKLFSCSERMFGKLLLYH